MVQQGIVNLQYAPLMKSKAISPLYSRQGEGNSDTFMLEAHRMFKREGEGKVKHDYSKNA